MKNDGLMRLIGLARRAGKVVLGSDGIEASVRSGKAYFVVLASDAAENTAKRLTDKCKSYDVPFAVVGTKQSLGKISGREEAAAVAVTDRNFATGMMRVCEENNRGVV